MTSIEQKALVERLRQVSSVLFDDYGDGTHAVEDYALAGKAADLIETQAREIERLREALKWYVAEDAKYIRAAIEKRGGKIVWGEG